MDIIIPKISSPLMFLAARKRGLVRYNSRFAVNMYEWCFKVSRDVCVYNTLNKIIFSVYCRGTIYV